jgi:hypothetical protein
MATKTYKVKIKLKNGKELEMNAARANVSTEYALDEFRKHFETDVLPKAGGMKGATILSINEADDVKAPDGESPIAKAARVATGEADSQPASTPAANG